MNYKIDDRDLARFFVYAARERGLDVLLLTAEERGSPEAQKKWLRALRDLNKMALFQETKRDPR